MGKKRITTQKGGAKNNALKARALSRGTKKKLTEGILHVESTFNNTRVSLTSMDGDLFFTSSSGSLGFKGAKKGTPFAAAKIGELIGEQSVAAGVKAVDVVVKGVGQGRESAIRGFISKGVDVRKISDRTPVPHNGPKPKKPRRI